MRSSRCPRKRSTSCFAIARSCSRACRWSTRSSRRRCCARFPRLAPTWSASRSSTTSRAPSFRRCAGIRRRGGSWSSPALPIATASAKHACAARSRRIAGNVTVEYPGRAAHRRGVAAAGRARHGSVVFTPGYFRDGDGGLFNPRDSAALMAAAAAAPVYGPFDTFIGTRRRRRPRCRASKRMGRAGREDRQRDFRRRRTRFAALAGDHADEASGRLAAGASGGGSTENEIPADTVVHFRRAHVLGGVPERGDRRHRRHPAAGGTDRQAAARAPPPPRGRAGGAKAAHASSRTRRGWRWPAS